MPPHERSSRETPAADPPEEAYDVGGSARAAHAGAVSWDDLDKLLPAIQWDWPGWLPRGFLTILASEPGMGKSHLCLHLAACYVSSPGSPPPFPDGAPFDLEPGAVIWCESEAGQALNAQRARRMGLDLSRILNPVGPLANFRLDNLKHSKALTQLTKRDDVRLIILDSLRGLRSPGKRSAPIAEVVSFLADIARATAKPVLLTHHLRKRTLVDARASAVDRLLGSSVIAQAARMIWAVDAPHPLHPDHRRLSVVKSNLGPLPDPLGFKIDDDGMHFGPPPQPPTSISRLENAARFLLQLLAEGPLPYKEIEAQAHAAGHTLGTIRRAKQYLGVESIKLPGDPQWHWSLPRENT